MKIEGPGKAQGASKTKKKDGVSGADSSFEDYIASGPGGAAPAVSTQSIAKLDALLTVQGVDDPAGRAARQRARHRADTILDELDKVRMAMLSGNLTVGHMVDIADVVAAHREKITDPVLTALMDEVDLRAQVELAKMRVALDSQ